MTNNANKREFIWLASFLLILVLILTNGFAERIFAQKESVDVYEEISPIGDVLAEIMSNYVEDPEVDKVVEGAIQGMMQSLDKHCSYMPPRAFKTLTEDTQGEFDGIGVLIDKDERGNLQILWPIAGSPAEESGIMPGDYITEIDGVSTKGITTSRASDLIKGPRGEIVRLTIVRFPKKEGDRGTPKKLEIDIKRGKISDESIAESRLINGNIGYVRITEFRKNTAKELRKEIEVLSDQGMKAFILDLRWNPGGLLEAPKDVCQLFLKKNSLVTYTKGRVASARQDDQELHTEKKPIIPMDFPIILLVNETSASSSEIVTGALQFHGRALVVGQKTYGKGTVQRIIQLQRPLGSALRMTTARYYTPAGVTIDNTGIWPDVKVKMSLDDSLHLYSQLRISFTEGANRRSSQDHGSVSGNEVTKETIEDIQLARAIELLNEETDFEKLLAKYHKDPSETQVASPENGGPGNSLVEGEVEGEETFDENGIPTRLLNQGIEIKGNESPEELPQEDE